MGRWVGRWVGKNLSLWYDEKISIAGGVVHTTITRKIRSTESKCTLNQRKPIVNSWEHCLENDQMVINSGFPTVNCRK